MTAGAVQVTLTTPAFSAALMRLSPRYGATAPTSAMAGTPGADSIVVLMTNSVRLICAGSTAPLTTTRQTYVPRGRPVIVQVVTFAGVVGQMNAPLLKSPSA